MPSIHLPPDVEVLGADESGEADAALDALTEADAAGDAETGAADAETGAAADGDGDGEDGSEVVITLGGEQPADDAEQRAAPDWVRDLRKANREKDRRIRELEQQVATVKPAPTATVVGAKPTLEACDFDTDKYDSELAGWYERKGKAEREVAERERAEEAQREAWGAKVKAYKAAGAALKVRDFEDAEAIAKDILSEVQQGILVAGLSNPAAMVYALGKNPTKARELSAMTDPVQFAVAIGKLEASMKIAPRKAASTTPERELRSGAAGVSAVDTTLDRLYAEAAKTGDVSKVVAYKAAKRAKEKASAT
jgi:hypothetical protein